MLILTTTSALVGLAITAAALAIQAKRHRAFRRAIAMRDAVLQRAHRDAIGPLNAIIGLSELLTLHELPQDQRQHLLTIRNEATAMRNLAENAAVYRQAEALAPPRPRTFGVVELMRDLKAEHLHGAATKRVHFEIHLEPQCPDQVHADPRLIRQILVNVIGHALAITDQGHVEVTVHADRHDGTLAVSVSDSGPVFSAETRRALFEPFGLEGRPTAEQPAGTGLHLCTARAIARHLGGDIACHARPQAGTVYSMEIPVAVLSTTSPDAAPPIDTVVAFNDLFARHRTQVPPKRILVAEDIASNRLLIEAILQRAGHSTILASDGDEALERISSDDSIDIVIVDLSMPQTGGMDVMKLGRFTPAGHARRAAFIVLTADTTEQTRQACLDAGASAFLGKPVSSQRVLEAVTAAVAKVNRAAAPGSPSHQAAITLGNRTGLVENALASSEPTQALLDSLRDALRYVAEAEMAASHADWPAVLVRVRAIRGVAYTIGARRVSAACRRILTTPVTDMEGAWSWLLADLVDELEDARRALSMLLDRPLAPDGSDDMG